MKRHFGLVTAAALLVAAPAHASQDQAAFDRAVAAVQARMEPIDAMEDRIPGRVLVFTSTGADPVVDVRGVANVETGQSADADTPFYIASMTKAFVGLMAVRLDMDGTLPLETTLAEIYPGMRVEGVDLSQVTLRDALSHRLGFNSPALSFRTSYTDAVPVGEFAKVVNASQEPTDRCQRRAGQTRGAPFAADRDVTLGRLPDQEGVGVGLHTAHTQSMMQTVTQG